jgi:hypothetical protein
MSSPPPVFRDQVIAVRESPEAIGVTFSDGLQEEISFDTLGFDMSLLIGDTARVADGNRGVVLTDIEGDELFLDGATLRYLADPAFAKEVDARTERIQLPLDRIDQFIDSRHGK